MALRAISGAPGVSKKDNSFPLLKLPPELRLFIYEELLVRPDNNKRKKLYPQILQTSKQIHREAEPILYSKNHFRVALSVGPETGSSRKIRVRTFLATLPYRVTLYERGCIYQSSVWVEALRKARFVSVAIAMKDMSLELNCLAINHCLAGLFAFLDHASEIRKVRLRLTGEIANDDARLQEMLQPMVMWKRSNPVADIHYHGLPSELHSNLVAASATKLNDPVYESVEKLFRYVRMAARVSARLENDNLHQLVLSLNYRMSKALAGVGPIGDGCQLKVEQAVLEVKEQLRKYLTGL